MSNSDFSQDSIEHTNCPDGQCGLDMADCEGFQFRFFAFNAEGFQEEVMPDEDGLKAENLIIERVNELLKGRQDLLMALSCLENGLEIHLYQGHGFEDHVDGLYFYGRATKDGDEVILEFATEEILEGGRQEEDVMDIVVHEMMHILDYLDDHDGLLPGWTADDIAQFQQARDVERRKIRDGVSPLVGYALTNDEEFLAVLAEVYFVNPAALKLSNPVLYQLMADYFRQDRAA